MKTHNINTWSNYKSWQSVAPPSRPAKWQIEECRSVLENIPKNTDIAVLGSTIEFRELLARMGFENVFIFERNKSFYDYITPFAKTRLHEHFIEGNWLNTLNKYAGTFGVIFSDLTSGNISYEDRDIFYKGISRSMLPNGVFIDRVLTKPFDFIELQKLIQKYSTLNINNRTVNSFNCEVLFCSSLLNNEDHTVDTTKFYDYLIQLNIPQITNFVFACYEITPRNCVWWYSKDWFDELDQYEKYFTIIKSIDEPESSEYYRRAKLFISSRNKV
jgi:hypothetical protein